MSFVRTVKTLLKVNKIRKSITKYNKLYTQTSTVVKKAEKKQYELAKRYKEKDLDAIKTEAASEKSKFSAAKQLKVEMPQRNVLELHNQYLKYRKGKEAEKETAIARYKNIVSWIPHDMANFRKVLMELVSLENDLATLARDIDIAHKALGKLKENFKRLAGTVPVIGIFNGPQVFTSLYLAADEAARQVNGKGDAVRDLQKVIREAKHTVSGELTYLANMHKFIKANPTPPDSADLPKPAR